MPGETRTMRIYLYHNWPNFRKAISSIALAHPWDLTDPIDLTDLIVNTVNPVPLVPSAWSPCIPGNRSTPRTVPFPTSAAASACRTSGTPAPSPCPFPWPRCVWRSAAR